MTSALPDRFRSLPFAHRALHDSHAGRPENSRSAIAAAVRAGYGIGFNQKIIGDADDKVCRLFDGGAVASMPLWLTAHPELRTTPRVRRIYDALRESLSKIVSPS